MLGKQFIVGLFECSSCKYLLFLQESQLDLNEFKLRGFCDGILAEEKSNVQLDVFKKALRIADEEFLVRCSLEQKSASRFL